MSGRSGIILVGALLAAIAAWALLAPRPAQAADEITIESSRASADPPNTITYRRQAVNFRGRLTTEPNLVPLPPGPAPGDRQVRLIERPFPYESARTVAQTRTNAQGTYRFTGFEPDYNSRYSVRVNDSEVQAASSEVPVFVYAQGRFNLRVTKKGRAKSKFSLRYSPKMPTKLGNRRVFWYFRKTTQRRFKVKDTTRSRERPKGTTKAKSTIRLPRSRKPYRFQITYCIKTARRPDIGIGPPADNRDCPRSFRASARAAEPLAASAGEPSGGLTASPPLAAGRR